MTKKEAARFIEKSVTQDVEMLRKILEKEEIETKCNKCAETWSKGFLQGALWSQSYTLKLLRKS